MIIKKHKWPNLELKKSLLLLSGGLDSVTLFYLLYTNNIPFECIIIDYGQPARKEITYSKKLCKKHNIKYTITNFDKKLFFKNKTKSPNKSLGLLPNRNSIFISMATTYALQNNITHIYYGAIGSTNRSFCDCQPEFIEKYNELLKVSDLNKVKIIAPFITKTKEEILELALNYNIDLNLCWSCDNNLKYPCNTCDSCRDRKTAEKNYKKKLIQKMSILNKSNYAI